MNAGPFYSSGPSAAADLQGKILLVPSVSLANLPQLAVDLLITSLQLERIGYVGTGDTVAPLVGYSDTDGIVTGGLELYGKPGSGLVILQQRSPTLKSRKEHHVELLHRFINSSGFEAVVILSSLDAANQDDAQLQTPHQVILPPNSTTFPASLQGLATLPPLSLNIEQPLPLSSDPSTGKTGPYPPFIPGGGLTRRLLSSLASAKAPAESAGVSKSTSSSSSSSAWVQVDQPASLSTSGSNTPNMPPSGPTSVPPHLTVVAWCVEGDNRSDAHALASLLLRSLASDKVKITEPESWKGLFGAAGWSGGYGQDAELYG